MWGSARVGTRLYSDQVPASPPKYGPDKRSAVFKERAQKRDDPALDAEGVRGGVSQGRTWAGCNVQDCIPLPDTRCDIFGKSPPRVRRDHQLETITQVEPGSLAPCSGWYQPITEKGAPAGERFKAVKGIVMPPLPHGYRWRLAVALARA